MPASAGMTHERHSREGGNLLRFKGRLRRHDVLVRKDWMPASAGMTHERHSRESGNLLRFRRLTGMTYSQRKDWIPAFAGMTRIQEGQTRKEGQTYRKDRLA